MSLAVPTADEADVWASGDCGCVSVAKALHECGVSYVFAVGGAPTTELGRQLQIDGPTFEWSFNEKVATEAAVGVSVAGGRSAILSKQCGLNIALDPLINAVYHGIGAGMIVLVGDDTRAKSSTVLQDSRHLAQIAGMPVLEMSHRSAIGDVIDLAYTLSETVSIPVVVRFREDLHAHVPVTYSNRSDERESLDIWRHDVPRGLDRSVAHGLTKFGRHQHHRISVWPQVREFLDHSDLVRQRHLDRCRRGVIAIGGSGDIPETISMCVLESDISWPLPAAMIEFVRSHSQIVVLEESLPFVETALRMRSDDSSRRWNIIGRESGELPPEGPLGALDDLLSIDKQNVYQGAWQTAETKEASESSPQLPYARLFEAITDISNEGCFVSADIGSSVKLCYPPYQAASVALCLGSPIGVSAGHARQTGKAAIAVIGDYGLLHSALEAVLEMVHHDVPGLIVILANGITAQTGGFPSPASKHVEHPVSLESVLRGLGVKHFDTWHVDELESAEQALRLRHLLEQHSVSVAIVNQGDGVVA